MRRLPVRLSATFAMAAVFLFAETNDSKVPNDSWFSTGYHRWAYRILLPWAWNITTGDNTIVIGVLDTGIDTTHQDLNGPIWRNEAEINGIVNNDDDNNGYDDDYFGWNFYNDNNNIFDENHGHGTSVAGIAVAQTNNTYDIAGTCGGWDTTYPRRSTHDDQVYRWLD